MLSNTELETLYGGVPEHTQIDELIDILKSTNIPFEVSIQYGRPQVWYPNREHPVCDGVCHWGSYGHQSGLIEIMGLTRNGDTVEGYLGAEEVFNRIKEHWEETGDRI